MVTNSSISFAMRLLDGLIKETTDSSGLGITRIAYGQGEQVAHRLFAELAREIGATVLNDAAGNTIARVDGEDPSLPIVATGSHLDSVRQGGNFDGAAGVAAGLAYLKEAVDSPSKRGLAVIAFRAEESCWFPHSYIGSRMALGRLPSENLDILRRSDTGRTLADHIDECGYDSAAVKRGETILKPQALDSFFEIHIEQGPVLDSAGISVGIIQAIAGGHRYRGMTINGVWSHAGAEPRKHRRDAMAATATFIDRTNQLWKEMEDEGDFLLVTFGIVKTDPELHAFSRIPGRVYVTIDIRAIDPAALKRFMDRLTTLIEVVSKEFGVLFHLGEDSGPPIRPMDKSLITMLKESADKAGIVSHLMASGAGHDAAAFSEAGISTAMVFIRNQNGSHNPAEDMQTEDFLAACTVLGDTITRRRALG